MEALFSLLGLAAVVLLVASAAAFAVEAFVSFPALARFAVAEGPVTTSTGAEPKTAPRVLAAFAAVALGAAIADRALVTHRPPYGDLFEYLVVVSFGMTVVYLLLSRHHGDARIGALVMALSACTCIAAELLLSSKAESLTPALQNNRLLAIHVACMIAAYSALAVAFAASAVNLLSGTPGGRQARSGFSAERLEHGAIMVGFPLLGLGIALGAYWGNIAWGRYWGWDPKETTALASWLVYAGYMHARVLADWKGRRASLLSVAGFAVILFNIFVVNFVLAGLHSYAGA